MIHIGVLGQRYIRREEDGQVASQFALRDLHPEVLSENLLVLADIDQDIFSEALEASDAVKELDHVRKSMIEHFSSDGPRSTFDALAGDRAFIDGFVDYATKEISDCEETLEQFYKSVTGLTLERHRVR